MFVLRDADLGPKIVGCGDGPASFNAEATRGGGDRFLRSDLSVRRRSTAAPFVETVVDDVRQAGFGATIEPIPYEFQRGGNQMLRIRDWNSVG